MEDICKDCHVFANHHRYLANHTMGYDDDDDGDGDSNGGGDGDSNGDSNGDGDSNSNGNSNGDGNGDGNGNGNGGGNGDGNGDGNSNGNGEGKGSNDRRSNDGTNNDGSNNFSNVEVRPIRNVDLNCPDAASTKVDKERELMLLQAVVHINMARAQQALYQAEVADAVADATARKEHLVSQANRPYLHCWAIHA